MGGHRIAAFAPDVPLLPEEPEAKDVATRHSPPSSEDVSWTSSQFDAELAQLHAMHANHTNHGLEEKTLAELEKGALTARHNKIERFFNKKSGRLLRLAAPGHVIETNHEACRPCALCAALEDGYVRTKTSFYCPKCSVYL